MKPSKTTYLLTFLATAAFAGNSLLCRWALKDTAIDAASFTSIRIASGALALWIIFRLRNSIHSTNSAASGNWASALALFTYAAAFSYAYVNLTTGTGALLLFAAVQLTMMLYAFWTGERFDIQQNLGLIMAIAGIVWLLLPNVSAPHLTDALLMLTAGVAWAIYSLRGKKATDAISVTTGNFMLATVFTLGLSLTLITKVSMDAMGMLLAVTSGAITSGVGYVIWYAALQRLTISNAAVVQLSVPIIAAIGGAIFLNDVITPRLIIASIATLSGVGLVLMAQGAAATK